MCLGVPFRVRALDAAGNAVCTANDGNVGERTVATALLDHMPRPGDWLLVHVDVAIRALEPAEATQISNALAAVSAAASGQPFEHLLADLVDREPQLPEHLRHSPEEEFEHG